MIIPIFTTSTHNNYNILFKISVILNIFICFTKYYSTYTLYFNITFVI